LITSANVSLKGTKDGLILYLNPDTEFSLLIEELKNHLHKFGNFLQGAAVSCYSGDKTYSEREVQELQGLLHDYGLTFKGFLSSEELAKRTSKAGNPPPAAPKEADEGMEEGNCLLVKRTVRSGQSIQYDGHVLVFGDVNPGAEIVATGHIFVMGVLRGMAHAGAGGNRNAVITAYQLLPTQIRIADIVTRPPADEGEARGVEIARIKDGQLIVESLMGNGPGFRGL